MNIHENIYPEASDEEIKKEFPSPSLLEFRSKVDDKEEPDEVIRSIFHDYVEKNENEKILPAIDILKDLRPKLAIEAEEYLKKANEGEQEKNVTISI